jgi:tetratricopeptide (TPR) repeat protein
MCTGTTIGRRRTIGGLALASLFLPGASQAADPAIPALSSLQEISEGEPAEGLYRYGANLVVIARYDVGSATANMQRDRALLLLRVATLMRDYVTQRGLPGAGGHYGKLLLEFASDHAGIVRYPTAARQLRCELDPTGGMLAMEFFDGLAVLEKSRADFEAINPGDLAHRFKRRILAAGNLELLALFAAENGEVIQTIISAADLFEKFRLYTLIPPSGNAALDAERTKRIHCQSSNCALSSELHLSQGRALLWSDPAKALVHLMLARLTTDPAIRDAASAAIGEALPPAARDEFLAVIRGCDAIPALPGKDLLTQVLRNCGIYWPPRPEDGALSANGGGIAPEPRPAAGAEASSPLEALASLLDSAPQRSAAWWEAGSLFRSIGRHAEAVAAFHQALLLAPASLSARLDLADAYAVLHARALARALYNDVLDRAKVADASPENSKLIATAQQRLDVL